MKQFLTPAQLALLFAAMVAIGRMAGTGADAVAQEKGDAKSPAKGEISAPPADINDLSMEVAALRTLYLLKAGPDQTIDRPSQYGGVKFHGKDCAQKPRQREKADVSANYRKVLTDLRAAFIAGNADRINELSDQLEELAKEEQPDLDDTVELTDQARKNAPPLLKDYFAANQVASYVAAYGKDFPDSYGLMYKTIRGKKPTPEQWKEVRAFVIREVSWQIGGLDLERQKAIGDQVAEVLDRAYPLSAEELDKEFRRPNLGMRGALAKITRQGGGPTDYIKRVVEQDLAEMLSNPRLLPAIESRERYLKSK
jgi:hypothetical protein